MRVFFNTWADIRTKKMQNREEECDKKKTTTTTKEKTGEEKKEKNGTYDKRYSSSCTKNACSQDFFYIHLAEQPMLDSFHCRLYILLLRGKKELFELKLADSENLKFSSLYGLLPSTDLFSMSNIFGENNSYETEKWTTVFIRISAQPRISAHPKSRKS